MGPVTTSYWNRNGSRVKTEEYINRIGQANLSWCTLRMVHLKLNTVYLDGICDFFHYLRFYGSCSNRSSGGPLLVIHGDEWVN
jgi:hypothetical protein